MATLSGGRGCERHSARCVTGACRVAFCDGEGEFEADALGEQEWEPQSGRDADRAGRGQDGGRAGGDAADACAAVDAHARK